MEKITIKYIPNLESAINIFSKDALTYYFDDFLNDKYKSSDIVEDYVDNYLSDKKYELPRKILLNDDVTYKTVDDVIFYKSMYKNPHSVKELLLNKLFDNPFDFEADTSTAIDVEYFNHNLKIYCSVPEDLIQDIKYQYKTSLQESLYSKLHILPITLQNTSSQSLQLNDNNFDYVHDVMTRYNKAINNMTDFEYDQIPKYTDKKQTSIKYKTQSTIDLEFWKDDLKNYITNTLQEYTKDDLLTIMKHLTEKNISLSIVPNMFVNKLELYNNIVNNNIELTDVYNNANNELKKKEIEQLLSILKTVKNNTKPVKEIVNYIDAKDTVFKNSYKFTKELIEIIDNEDENNLTENYFDYNVNILVEDITLTTDNDKYKTERNFIKGLGIKLDLQQMIEYLNKFGENERLSAMIFYTYYTLQLDIYTNGIKDDLLLNKECANLWYEYTEPMKIENKELVLPKSKSIYYYIICCFKNVIDKITEKDLVKRLKKLILKDQSCQTQLKNLQELWKTMQINIGDTDIKFYKSLVENLRKSEDNVKHIHFVKALRYIAPKKLKQVNKYISGCCLQLLDDKYKAFCDITNLDDKWLKYINDYLQKNVISYDNKWTATTYLPEEDIIEYEHFNNFNNDDDIDDSIVIDQNLDIINDDDNIDKYLKNQTQLNDYVKKCVDNFMTYVNAKIDHFSLQTFILEKCKLVQNVKHLLLAGCLTNSKFYYDCIEHLENICCLNYNLKIKKSKLCIYISARYLSELEGDKNDTIYENLKALNLKTVLSREEYNKSVNNYREELKVKAIDILESLTQEDKEIAMALKEFGIIETYDKYLENKIDKNTQATKIIPIVYKGDDGNDGNDED